MTEQEAWEAIEAAFTALPGSKDIDFSVVLFTKKYDNNGRKGVEWYSRFMAQPRLHCTGPVWVSQLNSAESREDVLTMLLVDLEPVVKGESEPEYPLKEYARFYTPLADR